MSMQVELPKLGESIDGGTVISILVSPGDEVDEGQGLIEVETDKATAEIPSPAAGKVDSVDVEEGDRVTTGQVIIALDQDEEAETPETPEEPEEPDESEEPDEPEEGNESSRSVEATEPHGPAVASPSVRRYARKLGLDVDDLADEAGGARVTREDVEARVRALLQAPGGRSGPERADELPDFSRWGAVEELPLNRIRRGTAEVVARSWRTIPQVTQFDRASIDAVEDLRRRCRDEVEAEGGRLTLTAVLIAAVARLLPRHPRLNSSLSDDGMKLLLKRYVHIGVAVDTEAGLLTPVIRDADAKGLGRIAAELDELSGRARASRLDPDDLAGASFTLTNLGGLGTTLFTPIIPWPQAAILAVGRAERRGGPRGGEGPLELPLGLGYDHRCVDGAEVARFLRHLALVLEEPLRLLLEPAGSRDGATGGASEEGTSR
ncbi:MAG: 2-oxo acid dehydrogenase subunit E2 [Planctomycetota bacterium]